MRRHTLPEILKTYETREEKKNRQATRGEVITHNLVSAMVKVGGSSRLTPVALPQNIPVSAGDIVELSLNRTQSKAKWVISDVLQKADPNIQRFQDEQNYSELFPPSNVTTSPSPPGTAGIQWDSPVTLPVVCEVQISTDDETWETTHYTRGAYAVIETATSISVRVRCIANNGQTSEWSTPITAEPSESISNLASSRVIDLTLTIPSHHHAYIVGPVEITGDLTVEGELIIL